MTKVQYWIVTGLAAASFATMAVNVALGVGINLERGEVAQRQQYVQQSVQLEGLYKEIIRALAELGARNNDGDVKALLQRHGITYNLNPAAAADAGSPGAAAKGRK